MPLPVCWSDLWEAYPDYSYYPDSKQLILDLLGKDTASWIGGNSCTIRLSRGLNYCGLAVQPHKGLTTVRGLDGKRYAFRVRETRPYLVYKYGQPDFNVTKKRGEAFDKTQLSGMKGIIGFEIKWADATGHFDLWLGDHFSHEEAGSDYWQNATRISLWKVRNPI